MPARLRPTAPIAPEAILVGDPGRALMLAQELLVEPKMSNHARGLWGYTGDTGDGRRLTIQATGMGGPSASVVLADLAELGVRRAVRVGTCAGLGDLALGEIVLVCEAIPLRCSFLSPDNEKEQRWPEGVRVDEGLSAALGEALADARVGAVASLDGPYHGGLVLPGGIAEVADMQTAALLAAAAELGVAAAALLVVSERGDSGQLNDEDLEAAAKTAGRAAAAVL